MKNGVCILMAKEIAPLLITKMKTQTHIILEKKIKSISHKESTSKFITYVTAEAGEAKTVSLSIIDKLEQKNIPLHTLVAVGADSTNVNTGI